MFVLYVNFRSFGIVRVVGYGIFVVILVISGSLISSMFIFRGNSRPFRYSAMVLQGSKTGFAW